MEDGGETYGDPRAYLADALFELGEADEARKLVEQIRADKPRDPEVYRTVAEVLYAQGDATGAHEWATSGADVVLELRDRAVGTGMGGGPDEAPAPDADSSPRAPTTSPWPRTAWKPSSASATAPASTWAAARTTTTPSWTTS